MRKTNDNRGFSYWDLFPDLEGQVNVSRTLKGQKRGFHLHSHKVDHWVVIDGSILVVLAWLSVDLGGSDWQFKRIVLKAGDDLTIETGLWHAYQALEDSTMIYYETSKSGIERSDDKEMPTSVYNRWNK